tara:strand:+ start:551 stop:1144 length:594 start_codon:yes stop_codon:yes gene_type:complete
MKKTPQHFRREKVKTLFNKILKENKTVLTPASISCYESLDDDFTTTDFSFEEKGNVSRIVNLTDIKGKGFIDGVFKGLYEYYVADYTSIEKIKLVDIMVNPIMKASKKLGSEAKASVLFRIEVDNHGLAEFHHESRSMIYSCFVSALEAFQFYINCERTFQRIKFIIDDATIRNRGDILQLCLNDLSKLTEVNTYER